MNGYRIAWKPRALKDAGRLDRRVRERIIAAVERLAEAGEGETTKLTDVKPPEYRLRVGDYRVRFARSDAEQTITVLRVLPRGEAYR